MTDPSAHSFPASHALQLMALVERFGVPGTDLLEGTGLSASTLDDPHARISSAMLVNLSERARQVTGEPGIGLYLGQHKRLTMYGFLGFAVMHASTLREAMQLFVRYSATVSTAVTLTFVEQKDTATLAIDEHIDLGTAHDIGVFSLAVGLRSISTTLTGRESGPMRCTLPIARPAYYQRLSHLLPDAHFGGSRLTFQFDAATLALPLRSPDRAALRLAQEACERELSKIEAVGDVSRQVRRLFATRRGFLGIEQAARSLGLSTRTLKRRLTAEGVTYSALVERERHIRAIAMLSSCELTLEAVAQELDYSTFANFARAFRRWTGESPAQHRRRARGARPSEVVQRDLHQSAARQLG
jgi:AraC-like DNA-binding protein